MAVSSGNKRGPSDRSHVDKEKIKKIHIVIPKISYDGVARLALTEANLFKKHYRISVIACIHETEKFSELVRDLDIKYLIRSSILSRLLYHKKQLNIKDADVIICHNLAASVLAFRNYKRNKTPYIAYIHDARFTDIPGSFGRFTHEEILESLENARAVLTNSKKTSDEVYERYKTKTRILYPGCHPSETISKRQKDYLLAVHPIYRSFFFTALERLLKLNQNIELVIIGGKRFGWQSVVDRFKELFGGRVKFIFNASDKVIEGHYSEAKMLIHPNIENFGLSPLEAAACGCPSIVARGSGVLEVLKEGTDILAYAAGNIDELHATINKFESDLALANKIKINAWKKAKRLSWDKHYSKLHKLVRGHAVDFDF